MPPCGVTCAMHFKAHLNDQTHAVSFVLHQPRFMYVGQGALGVILAVAIPVCYGQLTMCMPCFLTIAEKNRSGIQTFITVCCWEKQFLICVPSLVLGKVRSAVGSAQLLISQKFQQFRGLCEQNLVRIKPFCNFSTLQVCTGMTLRLASSVPNSGVFRHNNVYGSQQTQTHNNKIHTYNSRWLKP